MGVQLDINRHLSKTKLTASQYQQPVNELDEGTESTQETNIEVLLQILNVVQRRLGESLLNVQNNFAVMISLGNDQRLIIAFPGAQGAMDEERNRNEVFERMDRQLRNQPEQMQDFRSFRRHMQRIRPQPPLPELISRQIQIRQNRQQRPAQQIEELHSQFEQQREGSEIQQMRRPQTNEERQVQQLRHQRIMRMLEGDNQNQIRTENNLNRQSVPQGNDSTLDQTRLNQINKHFIKPKNRNQQELDEPLSCWQTFTRAVANFFRRLS